MIFSDFLQRDCGRRSTSNDCAAPPSNPSIRRAGAGRLFPPRQIRRGLRATPAEQTASPVWQKSPPRPGRARAASGRASPSFDLNRPYSFSRRPRWMARWRMTMLCSLLPVKYARAKGNSRSLTTRKSHWMPPSRITLAFVSPWAVIFRMPGCVTKHPITSAGFFDGREQIDVADDLLEPPQAARRTAADHTGMFAQSIEQRFGGAQCSAQQMFCGISPPPLDALEQIRLRFFAKAVQLRNLAGCDTPLQVSPPNPPPASG